MASAGGDFTGVAPLPAGLADLRRVLRLSMLSVGLLCCSLCSPLLSSLEIKKNCKKNPDVRCLCKLLFVQLPRQDNKSV
jgi:hypothetical protein